MDALRKQARQLGDNTAVFVPTMRRRHRSLWLNLALIKMGFWRKPRHSEYVAGEQKTME
ncbi:hypothetical protein KCP69_09195 [Salmonella enterica subsp. enterica]|nr:hypothetical protein KCP69_09195 [Salmonella enterica subsp. enterica]